MADISKKDKRIKVLKLIRKKKEISRAELSRLTGFTRPTISAIVGELESLGFVCETGKGESSGGKRPILLKLKENSLPMLGIDLADDNCIRGVICDLSGQIIFKHEESYENNFDILYAKTCLVIDHLMAQCQTPVKGIGVAVSGVVDTKKNDVIHSSNFDIENKGLASLLNQKYSLPIQLANRPDAAALAEKSYGTGQKYKNLVYLSTGQGVGAGIIQNGKIFYGSFGAAGEVGKMILNPLQDTATSCPNNQTLEYRLRAQFILDEVEQTTGKKVSYSELLKLFQSNDKAVEEKVYENAMYLAYGASVIANVINPEAIILGGRVKEFGEKYLDYFNSKFKEFIMIPQLPKISQTRIMVSDFGRDGVAFGGAVLMLNQAFNLDL